jgi:AraC-like DNA-binding protein
VPPFAITDALRPFVRSLRHYDLAGFPAGEHIGMPAPTITLIVALDPALDLSMPGGRRTMTSCLSGLHDGPATIHHQGVQRGLQAELTPLGLERLLGVPASAVSGVAVGLDDVLGPGAADALLDRIAAAPDWPARRRLLARALAHELARSGDRRRAPRPEVARAWSLLTATGGTARIADIAADVGWSTRHLAEQFAAVVGLTPKTVARIVRFQRSAALVRGGADLAEVAARCRFADQAHMTREWARLAGTSPTRWAQVDVLANVQDRLGAPG